MGKERCSTKSKAAIWKGVFSMRDELGKHIPRAKAGPGAALHGIKPTVSSGSLTQLSCLLLGDTAMSCYDLCAPTSCGPTPLANSCNEPCVRQCQDSTVVIQPSPVVVTLPGPILSSFPQNTAVGSSASAVVGNTLSEEGIPISSGSSSSGFGGFGGFGYSRPSHRYSSRPGEPC
ncbi:hypothetical protein Nmel_018691 [Mimus melanotis]